MALAREIQPQFFDSPQAAEVRTWARGAAEQLTPFTYFSRQHPHELDPALVPRLAELGLLGLEIPAGLGGIPMSASEQAVVYEELAKKDAALALDVVVLNSLTAYEMNKYGTREQKETYLPGMALGNKMAAFALTEPNKGSDAKGIKTRATRTEEGWVLNGAKRFITLGQYADVLVLAAKTGPEERRGHNITVFLVDIEKGQLPGVTISPWEKIGQKGSPLYEIILGDVFVPDDAVLGNVNEGWDVINDTLSHSRACGIAAQAVGLAQACLDEAYRYALQRPMYGDKLLVELPMALNLLHLMNNQIILSRKLVEMAARYQDLGHPKAEALASLAKLVACDTVAWAATEAMQLHGGAGYMRESRIARLWSDSPVLRIYEGAAPVQMGILEKNGIDRDFYLPFLTRGLSVGFVLPPEKVISPQEAEKLLTEKLGLTTSASN